MTKRIKSFNKKIFEVYNNIIFQINLFIQF